jgi:DNA-binding NtrC family response regulator
VSDSLPTEQQEDSGLRSHTRGRGAIGYLRVVFGKSTVAVHEVRGVGTLVGRNPGGDATSIQIDDGRMSRQHVRVEHGPAGWQLVDLGSRNGGFVDGRGFRPNVTVPIADGALIRLGDSLLVFRTAHADDRDSNAAAFPGVSPVAVTVRRRVSALAASPGHVLVLGETGTGKEQVARALADSHKGAPFVPQNCAELTRELARSELFGHQRGAFSGATHAKQGLVDLAGDGVLFLDEVGELALDIQGDLLRFLEDGSYRPLGSVELRHSAARVVAATNVDLEEAVANNRFRRDLAARLRASNAPLELPPLRERREDIPLWARMFFREVNRDVDEPWTVGALECLLLFPWLENLRELRGLVRSFVADGVGMPIPSEALPARFAEHRGILRGGATPPLVDDPTPPREPEKVEIEEALRRTGGRMKTAATQLGIDRRKLYRLCERFGIALEEHRANEPGKEE